MNKKHSYYKQIVMACINQKHIDSCTFIYEKMAINNLGEFICALSNTAALEKKPYAYAIFGINHRSYTITGCEETINNYKDITQKLSTNVLFSINNVQLDEKTVIIIEVRAAIGTTIQFEGEEYILINNNVEKLSRYKDLEKEILNNLEKKEAFETQIALRNLSASEVIELLDCKMLFSLLEKPYPISTLEIIDLLMDMRFVLEQNTGRYNISNLGALLLAKKLSIFKTVEYKAVRVLVYDGNDVTSSAHEQIGGKGYIVGFSGLIEYIMKKLPTVEIIDGVTRKYIPIFPTLSIRELVANAMIHQDLLENGGPIISIFREYIEITNPGIPTINFKRFIDNPPNSRNESLASAMHKVGFCEERGSGYDKVVEYIEKNNLPAPEITVYDNKTKVVLRAKKDFNSLTKDELILACYNHACLNLVQNKATNNTSLRERFKLSEDERYKVSRIFSETVEKGLIKIKQSTGTKNREYLPYWA